MSENFLIYGAYGYTGALIARLAQKQGLKPILAGRNADKTKQLGKELSLPYQVVDLNDASALENALQEVKAVLNCAGPFSKTARTMIAACMKTHTHYLDITGEIDVFEYAAAQSEAAQAAGIALIPGVGFDVVPSDCLAAYLKSKMADATHLELGLKSLGELSRGTTLTALENIDKGGTIRMDGKLLNVSTAHKTRQIPVIQGAADTCVSIPWGDVSTAYHSTGIPNIVVYASIPNGQYKVMKSSRYFGWLLGSSPMQALLTTVVKSRMSGPGEQHRNNARSVLWGEVRNAAGRTFAAKLTTKEGYQLTVETALESVLRILRGEVEPGFKTPSLAFGMDFIMGFNSERENL